MPRNITVTFSDGSSHVYKNAPDDITSAAAKTRAQKDFGNKEIVSLDGGKNLAKTSSAKSNPLVDLATGFAAPFQKLGSDVVQDFQERMAQADRGPPTSLGQFAKESFGNTARMGGVLADVGGLVAAPIQAGARAIAGQLSDLPLQAYSPARIVVTPRTRTDQGSAGTFAPIPLSKEQTKQQLEGDLMTAFSALAPKSRVPIVLVLVVFSKLQPKQNYQQRHAILVCFYCIVRLLPMLADERQILAQSLPKYDPPHSLRLQTFRQFSFV